MLRLTSQVMTKLAASKDFVGKETERLQKMIDDGSVKAAKKDQVRPHPIDHTRERSHALTCATR
jgi:hypothetical protein